MSGSLAVGLAQVTSTPYAGAENRWRTLAAAGALFDRGAALVVLPELSVPGYALDPARLRALAEAVDGPTVSAWTALAAARGGWIAGGFCERDGSDLFNAAVLVGGDGVLLHYRKLHLFGHEKQAFRPGDRGLPVVSLPFGTVGACVCYDLRFVETLRALTLKGAELVVVPTAWVAGFDSERWDRDGFCPQARGALMQANLDQAFVACASQAGSRGGIEFLGSSLLADPYGRAVAGPLPGTRDELALAQIDLDDVARAHARGAHARPRADRRTDVYGLAVDGTVL